MEKDDNNVAKLGARTAIFKILHEFNVHTHTTCNVVQLIRECGSGPGGTFEESDLQDLLPVCIHGVSK